MIGGGGMGELLENAREHFAGLPFRALTPADMRSNADTGLPARTRKLALGQCDAFMSHSCVWSSLTCAATDTCPMMPCYLYLPRDAMCYL